MTKAKVGIASDHAGIDFKGELIEKLSGQTFELVDLGPSTKDSVDYPDFAEILCLKILSREIASGVLICGTGIGMSIAANKFRGIRAALATTEFMATMAKVHNHAQVLCLGARVIDSDLGAKMIMQWQSATFEGGRHQNRLDKISSLEKKHG